MKMLWRDMGEEQFKGRGEGGHERGSEGIVCPPVIT